MKDASFIAKTLSTYTTGPSLARTKLSKVLSGLRSNIFEKFHDNSSLGFSINFNVKENTRIIRIGGLLSLHFKVIIYLDQYFNL
jgi:hypothetical protein